MNSRGSSIAYVETLGWELMIQFARYGMGIAVVNDFCTVPRGMVGIPLDGAPSVEYFMLSRKISGNNAAVKVLSKVIRESVTL